MRYRLNRQSKLFLDFGEPCGDNPEGDTRRKSKLNWESLLAYRKRDTETKFCSFETIEVEGEW